MTLLFEIKKTISGMSAWIANPRYRTLTLIAFGILVLLGFTAHALLQNPEPFNVFVLCVFAAFTLKIVHEYTVERAQIPTFSSSYFARQRMVQLLKNDQEQRGLGMYHIVDMGSGAGALTRAIAKAIPQASVTGIELSRFPYRQAVFMQIVLGIKNLVYINQNFMEHDYLNADAVVIFLNGSATQAAGKKLQQELKDGALVITSEFELKEGWIPKDTITFHTPLKTTLYVYRKT